LELLLVEGVNYQMVLFRLAQDGAKLWLDGSRVSVAIKNAFSDACLEYYENLASVRSHVADGNEATEANGPAALHRASPVGLVKAIKNAAELDGMRQAHLR
jgi:Xaa-Pro aminopeptidase